MFLKMIFRTECTETCKVRRREMENEIKQLRRDMKLRDDKLQQMERQAQVKLTAVNNFWGIYCGLKC